MNQKKKSKKESKEDITLLAKSYFQAQEYARVVNLFYSNEMLDSTDLKTINLATRCAVIIKINFNIEIHL